VGSIRKARAVSTAQLDLPLEDGSGFSFVLDLAGIALMCFVSRLALVERAAKDGVQLYRGLPVGAQQIAEFFEQYQLEIEHVARANFRAGRCGGEHDVLVLARDLNGR
jgi:hypothetical protein